MTTYRQRHRNKEGRQRNWRRWERGTPKPWPTNRRPLTSIQVAKAKERNADVEQLLAERRLYPGAALPIIAQRRATGKRHRRNHLARASRKANR